jgi:glutathione synthase/RimK-type ligase-like ATP-grasp enzyme
MKIAIHFTEDNFSERWIEYCQKNAIDYKLVNCYDTNIIQDLNDCDALMWHHHHREYKDVLFAKQLLYSVEFAGKKVFPNFDTAWHFDDKIGQKYLFEALGVPSVPTYIFYTKKEAMDWIESTTFPKVFKLRAGAGASNVNLARTKKEAISFTNRAFSSGFSQFDRMGYLKDKIMKVRAGKEPLIGILKGIGRLFIPTEFAKMSNREKGYVYFQEFLPSNTFDIRVVVVGDKAFGNKRINRKDDFRASGSRNYRFEKNEIDERCVQIAFEVNKKLNSQSTYYDFVFDEANNPLILEISYCSVVHKYDKCPGYWDENLNFHEGKFNPQYWHMENLISTIKK